MQTFDYDEAFSRNIGWVTESEQATLRDKRVAVGGLGGRRSTSSDLRQARDRAFFHC